MKILLHACCGPCACYPSEKLAADGKEFDILYFNPNIHPYKEFKQRLATLREFCEKKQIALYIDKNYDLEETVRGMVCEPTVRCAYCYRVRMRYAAKFAKENGYDAFSTTLLVSPYQKHALIIKEAEAAERERLKAEAAAEKQRLKEEAAAEKQRLKEEAAAQKEAEKQAAKKKKIVQQAATNAASSVASRLLPMLHPLLPAL